jgi:hypothetical protein
MKRTFNYAEYAYEARNMGCGCEPCCWQAVKLVAITKVVEYAPNMYHSVAYEPLTQITDEGIWRNG